ncbi:MAG: ABC transporter substrate-binding protein [Nitrososphaerales archaeon]
MNKKGLTKLQLIIIIAIIAIAIITTPLSINLYLSSKQTTQQPLPSKSYLIDILGRNVTLPERINRIVAIGPGMLRLVCYLNAYELIVGVEESEISWGFIGRDYAMAFGENFKKLPIIGPGGPGKPPAPELILTVKPDLIIMSRTYVEMYDPNRLEIETNSKVIVMDYGIPGYLDVKTFIEALRTLGQVLNKKERVEDLIKFVNNLCKDLEVRTKDISSRPKVYVGAVSYRGPQPFTTTQISFPPLTLLHTSSIADKYSNKTGVFFWNFEAILKEQPDIIFIDEGNLNTVKQDFDKDPSKYLKLNAFKNNRVFGTLPYNYYHTNIAVALADAYYIGKVLYPEKFADIDSEKKADEIFNAFLGKPLYQSYKEVYGGFKNLSELFKVS